MKVPVLLFLSFLTLVSSAQLADSVNPENADRKQEETNSIQKNAFFEKYDLANHRKITAKMIDAGKMRKGPAENSELYGFTIPQLEIIQVYRYFVEEKCWAAQYQDNWGFIDGSLVFPIRDSKPEEEVTSYDKPPQLLTQIKPKYPSEAREAGITGKVYIKVFIDKEGEAKETIVLQGIEELNQAAIDAIKQAKYKPAERNDKPVGVWVNLSLEFE